MSCLVETPFYLYTSLICLTCFGLCQRSVHQRCPKRNTRICIMGRCAKVHLSVAGGVRSRAHLVHEKNTACIQVMYVQAYLFRILVGSRDIGRHIAIIVPKRCDSLWLRYMGVWVDLVAAFLMSCPCPTGHVCVVYSCWLASWDGCLQLPAKVAATYVAVLPLLSHKGGLHLNDMPV